MENSKIQTQVITLGKLLVNELGLESSVDTLARWMAHYIAEKIVQIEIMPAGAEKDSAEKNCYDAILKLWDRRWSFPPELQPLKDFKPILKVLQMIDPKNESPFFYRHTNELLGDIDPGSDLRDIKKHIELIGQIDKTARIWIDTILNQAILDASKENTKEILANAIELPNNEDVITIQEIMIGDNANYVSKNRLEFLNSRIKELENFCKLNDVLLECYKRDLAEITKDE